MWLPLITWEVLRSTLFCLFCYIIKTTLFIFSVYRWWHRIFFRYLLIIKTQLLIFTVKKAYRKNLASILFNIKQLQEL